MQELMASVAMRYLVAGLGLLVVAYSLLSYTVIKLASRQLPAVSAYTDSIVSRMLYIAVGAICLQAIIWGTKTPTAMAAGYLLGLAISLILTRRKYDNWCRTVNKVYSH